MTTLDLKKVDKTLYAPSAKAPAIVDVPPMHYLMVDGQGNPNTAPAYQTAVQVLYALSYEIRAISKAAGTVYTVMPLEGLWWFATGAPIEGDDDYKDKFLWTMMIRQPDHITAAMVDEARVRAAKKKPDIPFDTVRLERLVESTSAQIMYIGPYADEKPTIDRLHAFVEAEGYTLRGKHHEIYLSDPRRTAPDRLKTVIRHPVA